MITAKHAKIESPSKRMRSVIFRLWEREETDLNPQEYYEHVMEKQINELKQKLA